jgi:hypothetical protein
MDTQMHIRLMAAELFDMSQRARTASVAREMEELACEFLQLAQKSSGGDTRASGNPSSKAG